MCERLSERGIRARGTEKHRGWGGEVTLTRPTRYAERAQGDKIDLLLIELIELSLTAVWTCKSVISFVLAASSVDTPLTHTHPVDTPLTHSRMSRRNHSGDL